jgi:translation elongation factor EF-Ts
MTMITPEIIEMVQTQTSATPEEAKAALEKSQGNLAEAIALLLDAPPLSQRQKTAWDERREICEAYEKEMKTYIESVSTKTDLGTRSIPYPPSSKTI